MDILKMSLEQKHNIIMVDEDFIGKVENLINYFIESLVYNLRHEKDNENRISNIDITNDILKELQQCYETDIVRVCYNSMGAYYINENGLER